MKVLIDSGPILGYPTGISIYTLKLMEQLNILEDVTISSVFATWRVKLAKKTQKLLNEYNCNSKSILLPPRLINKFPSLVSLYSSKLFKDVNIFHSTTHLLPGWASNDLPFIITIHDLAGFRYPNRGYWPSDSNKDLDHLHKTAKESAAILTVSEFSKSEIVGLLQIPEEKVFVTHLAPQWRKGVLMGHLPKELEANRFFLSVGTLSPRKNYLTLLNAFKNFNCEKHQMKLVIVGSKGWNCDREIALIEEMDNVIWLREISDNDLFTLYKNARALLMPSWYEGFGIPIIEAIDLKCPAVFAKGSSMDEVGDSFLGIEPSNVSEWTDKMSELMDDEFREKAIESCTQRRNEFSWAKTAEKTIECYKFVYENCS